LKPEDRGDIFLRNDWTIWRYMPEGKVFISVTFDLRKIGYNNLLTLVRGCGR
jgi:hypothetical protein